MLSPIGRWPKLLACTLVASSLLAQAVSANDRLVSPSGVGSRGWLPISDLHLASASVRPVQSDATAASDDAEEEEEDAIETDRPDFTEASSNIPAGRAQLEAGYTFTYNDDDGVRSRAHSAPELLYRIGMTDQLELRIGWNYLVEQTRGHTSNPRTSLNDNADGAADLYLGLGVALLEQCGWIPEAKINLQTTAPTGADAFSSDKFNPGFNLLYGWDLNDFLAVGMSTGINTATEDDDDFVKYSQSFTIGYSLSEQLGAYTELFGIFSSDSAANAPENYFNGGLTYKVTPDFQLDIRAGVGLNDHADDFFTGAGFAIRY